MCTSTQWLIRVVERISNQSIQFEQVWQAQVDEYDDGGSGNCEQQMIVCRFADWGAGLKSCLEMRC